MDICFYGKSINVQTLGKGLQCSSREIGEKEKSMDGTEVLPMLPSAFDAPIDMKLIVSRI